LLGFKFKHLTEKSLYDLAALLIKHEIVGLPDIWAHFEPDPMPAEDEIEKLLG
jgi:hypothetical protein